MLSVFLVIGLGLILAAVSFLVRVSTRPPSPHTNAFLLLPIAPLLPDATDQLVLVVGPPAADVIQVCTEFRALYQDRELTAYPFWIHAMEPGVTALTFPHNLPAEFFYYLINYLSYPESGYRKTAEVRGWATLPTIRRDKGVAAPESVLVCVPPDDTDYDAVLLVTPEAAVYKLTIGSLLPILCRDAVSVAYTAPPYLQDMVLQISGTELQ
jgi:hypothetical protein